MQQRFYNLDGLRFLAALIVVISHVESIKKAFGIPYFAIRLIREGAQLAVTFFFVLSGFLITWILLKEKKERQDDKINVFRFYKKRILRIWPLYYLLVLLVFLVIGPLDFFRVDYGWGNESGTTAYWQKMTGYLFFLPNYTGIRYGGFVYISHVWSLGVEEFFYLFFPIGIYFVRSGYIKAFLVAILIASLAVSMGIQLLIPDPAGAEFYLRGFASSYRLYSFALGALAAYLFLNQQLKVVIAAVRFLKNKTVITIGILVLLTLLLTGTTFWHFTQPVYSLLFAMFLFAISVTGIRLWIINTSPVRYLGKISYGIYMFHPLAIVIAVKCAMGTTSSPGGIVFNVLIYGLSITLAIVLAMVSYETYEKFFLKYARKKRGDTI